MRILITTFRLHGLDAAGYWGLATAVAPQFARVPGLVSKVWLADTEAGVYGGVYAFEDQRSLDAYLHSELVRSMRANPYVVDLTLRTFGTIEAATRVTRGPLTVMPGGAKGGASEPTASAEPASVGPESPNGRLVWRSHEAPPVPIP